MKTPFVLLPLLFALSCSSTETKRGATSSFGEKARAELTAYQSKAEKLSGDEGMALRATIADTRVELMELEQSSGASRERHESTIENNLAKLRIRLGSAR